MMLIFGDRRIGRNHLHVHTGPECVLDVPRATTILQQQISLIELRIFTLNIPPHCLHGRWILRCISRWVFALQVRLRVDTFYLVPGAIGAFWTSLSIVQELAYGGREGREGDT